MRINLVVLLTLAVWAVLVPSAGAFPGASGAIVFQSANRGSNGDIDLWLRSPSGKLTDLTKSPGNDTAPAVSPDGKKVVFVSNRDGNDEIYVIGITGGRATRLTHNTTNDEEPTW
jgi:Tol biopolymer transport system component